MSHNDHGDFSATHSGDSGGSQRAAEDQLAPRNLLLEFLHRQAQIQTQQTEILARLVQEPPRGENAHKDGAHDNLRRFLRLKPPAFLGSANPMEADDWLTEIEKVFNAMHCPEEEKVALATFKLHGGAFDWWSVHKTKYPTDYLVTWATFKEEFRIKYFPESVRIKLELEFLQLKQAEKSVAEYEVEFSRLARYALAYVENDEVKARRFAQGLRQPIKGQVEVFELKSFREVANKALAVEQAYVEDHTEVESTEEEDERTEEETTPDETTWEEGNELEACFPQLPNTGN